MSNTRTKHLTDAEFSDLLAGERTDEASRLHLADCEYCAEELRSVRASLASFDGLSSQWAFSAAPARVPVPSRWALHLGLLPSWTTGLAVTAMTGLLVFNFGPAHFAHRQERLAPAAQTATVAVPSNTELADDNRLMRSIDQELGYGERSDESVQKLSSGDSKLDHTASNAVID